MLSLSTCKRSYRYTGFVITGVAPPRHSVASKNRHFKRFCLQSRQIFQRFC
ncbi:hypothetical protein [Caudoviricetes sp.]|nr:hypothetical protein [Caudoviricetes sp.]